MDNPNLTSFIKSEGQSLAKGPIALLFIEDDVEIETTQIVYEIPGRVGGWGPWAPNRLFVVFHICLFSYPGESRDGPPTQPPRVGDPP